MNNKNNSEINNILGESKETIKFGNSLQSNIMDEPNEEKVVDFHRLNLMTSHSKNQLNFSNCTNGTQGVNSVHMNLSNSNNMNKDFRNVICNKMHEQSNYLLTTNDPNVHNEVGKNKMKDNYQIQQIMENINEYEEKYPKTFEISKRNKIEEYHTAKILNLLSTSLAVLPFSLNNYIIGTAKLKEVVDNKYNNCLQLYKMGDLMQYIYSNEIRSLVDNRVYNLLARYKVVKVGNGKIHPLNLLNFKEQSDKPTLERVLIDKSKILIYKIHSFVEGRGKNLSYIYEICYGLSYSTETFLLATFIFDFYLHKINAITQKNHYRKIKIVVIISAILLALIKTETYNGNSVMFLSDILSYLKRKIGTKNNYTCIEIANKQMEILKMLPINYNNYWSFAEIAYLYFINLKNTAQECSGLKTYYTFLENYGFLYFIYDVIYGYGLYVTAIGSYKLIPASRIVATVILYFTNAFFVNLNNSIAFQEMFCSKVFHVSFTNDLFLWSSLFLDNFIFFFEHCDRKHRTKNYLSIYSVFVETGKILDIQSVF